MKTPSLIFLSLVSLIAITSCHKDDHSHDGTPNQAYLDTADCSGITVTYTADVKPVFDASCATSGCHDAASAQHSVILDNYANSKASFEAHTLLCSINHGSDCAHMPQGGAMLTFEQIQKITCWAQGGFPQ
jgi:hypothetical protein